MVGANSPKPLISLRHVGFSYGKPGASFWGRRAEHSAIRDISFDVYPGETVGIIGGNGAGKTTLLKLIAGVLKPAVGTITRADVRISMLSLQVGFLPHLTGRENAILGGLLLGLSKEQAKKNLALIEEFSELQAFIDEPFGTYSSGMKARLGFSVAYFASNEVVLIDEVLGVGDRDFRIKSTAAIKEMITTNRTVVLVSHNVATLRETANRVVWISEGATHMEGDPADILEAYAAS